VTEPAVPADRTPGTVGTTVPSGTLSTLTRPHHPASVPAKRPILDGSDTRYCSQRPAIRSGPPSRPGTISSVHRTPEDTNAYSEVSSYPSPAALPNTTPR